MDANVIPATSGIYRIVNTINGKLYIGSAVNLRDRKRCHFKELRHNTHRNSKLQHAWNKYGSDNFTFEIIELVLIPELLTAREQYWIDKLKPFFNIARIAGSQLGVKRSPETRAKLSASRLGKPAHNRGKKASPEARANMSASQRRNPPNLGKKFSPEHCAKIGAASLGNKSNLGRKRSPEAIEKSRIANTGRAQSEETRKKHSIANMGLTNSLGVKRSPETIARLIAVSRDRMKILIVTDPNGIEYTVQGVKGFCREHDLDISALMRVANGKRSHHKGFKARFPDVAES